MGQLLDLANTDPNNVPVLMALAHGFLLLKQTAKARNQLKVGGAAVLCTQLGTAQGRLLHPLAHSLLAVTDDVVCWGAPAGLDCMQRVSKLPYVPEDADEFERAWLALADIHVAGGKFDLAQVRAGCRCKPLVGMPPHSSD